MFLIQFTDGSYLKDYDPEASERPGHFPTGSVKATRDPADAMKFESIEAAVACRNTQSKTVPLRPDGLPNRPLSALTVTIVREP